MFHNIIALIRKISYEKPADRMQVLERDLAIFGFFIALGRRTQSYLSDNGYDVADHPLESYLRCSQLDIFWFHVHLVFSINLFNCNLPFVQIPHWGKCSVLSSVVIDKFLPVVCRGQSAFVVFDCLEMVFHG